MRVYAYICAQYVTRVWPIRVCSHQHLYIVSSRIAHVSYRLRPLTLSLVDGPPECTIVSSKSKNVIDLWERTTHVHNWKDTCKTFLPQKVESVLLLLSERYSYVLTHTHIHIHTRTHTYVRTGIFLRCTCHSQIRIFFSTV